MKLTVHRAPEYLPGTWWRPAVAPIEQEAHTEQLRRATGEGQSDKVTSRLSRASLQGLDLLLAGSNSEYTEARIEDSYKKGRFVEGYLFVRALGAFIHEESVNQLAETSAKIHPGVIISRLVHVDDDVEVHAYAELEQGVRLKRGAVMGAHSVARRRAQLGENAGVGAGSYIGHDVQIGPNVTIGAFNLIDRSSRMDEGTTTGLQVHLGRRFISKRGSSLLDSVSIGDDSFTGQDVTVGEMTTAGHHLHIGDNSVVGSESVLGDFVRIGRNVFLVSPTYAANHEVLLQSNLFSKPPGNS